MVGQRCQNEVVRPQHVPLEAVGAFGVNVCFEHTANEILRQRIPVELLEESPHGSDE